MVIWSGKVVMVSFSPAPVTSGVDPSGKEFESMLPLVMCLSSVICSSSVSDNSSLNNGVGSPSKAALVGAKIVIGPLVESRSTRSPIFNKETKVEKLGLKTSRSRMEQTGSQMSSGILEWRVGGWIGREGNRGWSNGENGDSGKFCGGSEGRGISKA